MDIDLSQYMGMYIDGSKENLDLMDKYLLALEEDPTNIEAVNEIFRAAHTLKGMSATMGFEKIAQLTHEMENILDKMRKKEVEITSEIIDLLFETFDILRVLVNDSITATDSNIDLNEITTKLSNAITQKKQQTKRSEAVVQPKSVTQAQKLQTEGKAATDLSSEKLYKELEIAINEYEYQVVFQALQQGINAYLLEVHLVHDCLLKAPRAFMVVKNLEELECEIIKSIPDTKDLEQEKFDLSFVMLIISKVNGNEIKNAIEAITEIEKVNIRQINVEELNKLNSKGKAKMTATVSEVQTLNSSLSKVNYTSHAIENTNAAISSASIGARSQTESYKPELEAAGQYQQQALAKTNGQHVHSINSGIAQQHIVQPQLTSAQSPSSSSSIPPKPPVIPPTSGGSSGSSSGGQQPKKQVSADKRGTQTIRVDMRRLDDLMNLVGELVINRTRLQDIGAKHKLKDLNETLARISQISSALQNVVMQVRMVPIEQVFDRFPRMVRDLAKKLNKKINLEIEGKETEMDRTVIDEIGDPMVHLIRNAIDHGIESPEERIAKGKPETGTIWLIARHEGNNVIIEVRDDGKGIDPNVVGRVAVERGVVTPEQLSKMTPDEIIKLIFLPGFSTAKEVSDISGRGVGMDAVKSKIDELNGSLEVESKVGEGTRVIIKLPLTLAILPALMVKVGDEIFAIPLGSVQETMDITKADINIVQHQEVTLLRGEVLPIIRLRNLLQVPTPPDYKEKEEEISIVVCASGEKRAGFMVDELLGQQEIVIKSLGNLLSDLPGIMGATMRGDGSIALILDIPTFLQMKGANIQ